MAFQHDRQLIEAVVEYFARGLGAVQEPSWNIAGACVNRDNLGRVVTSAAHAPRKIEQFKYFLKADLMEAFMSGKSNITVNNGDVYVGKAALAAGIFTEDEFLSPDGAAVSRPVIRINREEGTAGIYRSNQGGYELDKVVYSPGRRL